MLTRLKPGPASIQEHLVPAGGPQGQIKVAIVVEVGHLRLESAGFCKGGPCIGRVLQKSVLALVEIQKRRTVVAQEHQVRVAVIVEVRIDGAAHASFGRGET